MPLCHENRKNGLKINFKRGIGEGEGVLEGYGVGAAGCDCAHPYRYRTAAEEPATKRQGLRSPAQALPFSAPAIPRAQIPQKEILNTPE